MKRHTFTTRIRKMGVLRCVIVPPHIVKGLGSATRIPVLARYGGETTFSTLAPAGGAKRRLVLQMSVLRPASLDAGDMIEVSLELTTESHKQGLLQMSYARCSFVRQPPRNSTALRLPRGG